jgi:hypothetical protein
MLDPVKDTTSFMFGKTHKDLHTSIRPVEAGFDILRRLAEVEEALVGKILSHCSTAPLLQLEAGVQAVVGPGHHLVHGKGDSVEKELGRGYSKQGGV